MKTITYLEERLYKPIFGIPDLQSYKREASGIYKVKNITTPLLILKSHDDPIIGWDEKDIQMILENPNIVLATTKYGGHIGYYESYLSNEQFQNKPIINFFEYF